MERFHSYLIKPIKKIGEGAFGYVEKIELYNLNNDICGIYGRKILSPKAEILKNISLDEVKRRFIREVIYQSNCSSKNIISICLFNQYIDTPYFIMELGICDLQKDIESEILNEDKKIEILTMIVHGMKNIHDKEYLHRDIKPQNIIKFPCGAYKISDFGLVKNTDESSDTTALTAIGQTMGTQKYMAPETLYSAEYSKQTDIYAMGKVMGDLKIENKIYQDIIKKCCSFQKSERYLNIDEVISDIDSIDLKIGCGQ